MDKNGSDFITEYTQSRDALIKSPPQAAAVWASFMKFALQWVAQENVLDLGFVTLTPTPFRYDWFDRLIVERKVRTTLRRRQLHGFKFAKWHLTKARITACADEKTVRWNLLVVPSESFHRALAGVEKKRWQTSKYVEEYHDRVKKLLDRHAKRNHEILKTYLEEAAHPPAKICDSFLFIAHEIREKSGKKWATAILQLPTLIVDVENASGRAGSVGEMVAESPAVAVAPTDAGVHALSNLQSPVEDVRDSRNEMASTRKSESGNGSIGLPLPNAVQGETVCELLAVRPDGGHDGLGTSPEQLADHEACYLKKQ